jgi:hypothetical protein
MRMQIREVMMIVMYIQLCVADCSWAGLEVCLMMIEVFVRWGCWMSFFFAVWEFLVSCLGIIC